MANFYFNSVVGNYHLHWVNINGSRVLCILLFCQEILLLELKIFMNIKLGVICTRMVDFHKHDEQLAWPALEYDDITRLS